MELKDPRERWKHLLEKANKGLTLLKRYTKKLENADQLSPAELDEINLQCRKVREEINTYMEEMNVIAKETGSFFKENKDLANLYNEFHEEMRNVHEITLRVMKVLKEKMVVLDEQINMLRKKKHAIAMYKSHEMFR